MAGRLPGSFRDPAGHVYLSNDILYRRIEPAGRDAYERLMQSGLYAALVADGLLVSHEDLGPQPDQPGAWTVVRPERVPMVSYPYEWCFSQLRDAALLVLRVQRRALDFGLVLKDASAYNVQFLRGRPVFIDTLSFEPLRPGPWLAYRQFCQHFYAPLLLLTAADPRLVRLSLVFIDGVPLPLASRLLPASTWLRSGPLMHLHLHAKAEETLAPSGSRRKPPDARSGSRRKPPDARSGSRRKPPDASKTAVASGLSRKEPLLDSLERAIAALEWTPRSNWSTYYEDQPSYEQAAFERKRAVVGEWLQRLRPSFVWDLGANTGQFSRLAIEQRASVVAFDADVSCVELMYRSARDSVTGGGLLPLVSDLANPSPAIGWANTERMTLEQRGPADLILALALIHHLAIANNVPFAGIAAYFARLARHAIVEFVPRADAMVQQMIAGRGTSFPHYDRENFERAFEEHFSIDARATLEPSERVLYLLSPRIR